jgi:hypothetical protein
MQVDEDVQMEAVIQESDHEGEAEDTDEGPVTRGGRNLRVSSHRSPKFTFIHPFLFGPFQPETFTDILLSLAQKWNNHPHHRDQLRSERVV